MFRFSFAQLKNSRERVWKIDEDTMERLFCGKLSKTIEQTIPTNLTVLFIWSCGFWFKMPLVQLSGRLFTTGANCTFSIFHVAKKTFDGDVNDKSPDTLY